MFGGETVRLSPDELLGQSAKNIISEGFAERLVTDDRRKTRGRNRSGWDRADPLLAGDAKRAGMVSLNEDGRGP